MEPKQLINKIREAYLDARKIAYTPKENNKKIKRGTSHSISSLMEDLLGVYCAERINNSEQMQIYIDPPLSFKDTDLKNKSQNKALLFRPDICIINSPETTSFIDVKTDLGYKRKKIIEQVIEKNRLIKSISGKTCRIKDGITKESERIRIGENIKLLYVIISNRNISKKSLNNVIEEFKKLEHIDISILMNGDHPNTYKTNSKFIINYAGFEKLNAFIQNS